MKIGSNADTFASFPSGRSDIAFIDRADIKMYIGLPSPKATNAILCSSLNELGRAGIIHSKVGRLYSLRILKTLILLSTNVLRLA
jgi:hypothetical protein